MKDDLTQADIERITGVKKKAHDRIQRQLKILRDAGIYCWLKETGEIGTTWHHVHNAGPETKTTIKLPNLSAVK